MQLFSSFYADLKIISHLDILLTKLQKQLNKHTRRLRFLKKKVE